MRIRSVGTALLMTTCAAALAPACSQHSPTSERLGKSSEAIVGGTTVSSPNTKGIVQVTSLITDQSTGKHRLFDGTGAVVTPTGATGQWILTAGHIVLIGSNDVSSILTVAPAYHASVSPLGSDGKPNDQASVLADRMIVNPGPQSRERSPRNRSGIARSRSSVSTAERAASAKAVCGASAFT